MALTFLLTFIIISLCFLGIGAGLFFLGTGAVKTECGNLPTEPDTPCLSQQAGICPIEDKSGILRMTVPTRLRFK